MKARIIKLISNKWTVQCDNKRYECKCIGKFRYQKISPVVGDMVEIDENKNLILKVLPRKNFLIRPPIANVDQAIILVSCKAPDFSSNLLDKMLVIIEYNNIKPVICFTKYDLLDDTKKMDEIIKYYKSIGYDVYINNELDDIKEMLNGKLSVLTGQTGVGKSSLLNSINPYLKLKTGEISKALGRGRHTTRCTQLLEVEGGLVADTPGFSSIDFSSMDKMDIMTNFPEFYERIDKCKYKDCIHIKEDGCYIKQLVENGKILSSRYENYKKFIEEISKKRR